MMKSILVVLFCLVATASANPLFTRHPSCCAVAFVRGGQSDLTDSTDALTDTDVVSSSSVEEVLREEDLVADLVDELVEEEEEEEVMTEEETFFDAVSEISGDTEQEAVIEAMDGREEEEEAYEVIDDNDLLEQEITQVEQSWHDEQATAEREDLIAAYEVNQHSSTGDGGAVQVEQSWHEEEELTDEREEEQVNQHYSTDEDSSAFVDREELADAYDSADASWGLRAGAHAAENDDDDRLSIDDIPNSSEEEQEFVDAVEEYPADYVDDEPIDAAQAFAQQVAAEQGVETTSNDSAPVPLIVSEDIRNILVKECGFKRWEVQNMKPAVAHTLAQKRLQRPLEGIPASWYENDAAPSQHLVTTAFKVIALAAPVALGCLAIFGSGEVAFLAFGNKKIKEPVAAFVEAVPMDEEEEEIVEEEEPKKSPLVVTSSRTPSQLAGIESWVKSHAASTEQWVRDLLAAFRSKVTSFLPGSRK